MPKALLSILILLSLANSAYAAASYGTSLPEGEKVTAGIENYLVFKRCLEGENGKIKSQQRFLLLSYGVTDWFSLDLKGGAGNVKQDPPDGDEIDYPSGFAGGYGFRLRLYDKENIKMLLGFQHISVHPQSKHIGNVKHRAILDDWQWSLLASWSFDRLTPYIGTRWSRMDYIHWRGDERKRIMSDLTKGVGLIVGLDARLLKKIRINLEGQFFDLEACSFSLNYDF